MTTHTKTPHTPAPWKVVRDFRCDGDQDYTYYYVRDALGSQVATVDGNCYPSSGEVVSERIVRAVNAHELLVEALEAYHGVLFRVVTAVSAKGTFSQAHMGNMFVKLLEDLGDSKAVAKARAALRAAKEEV